jgi:hypothetical protein
MVYFIRENQKFNTGAELMQLQDSNKQVIIDNIKNKNPLLIHNLINDKKIENISFKSIVNENPGYIINDNDKNISLSIFDDKDIKQIYILDNINLIKDLEMDKSLKNIKESFSNELTFNQKTKLNLLKGIHRVNIQKNKNDSLLFTQIHGETIFYIINPKHSDIIGEQYDKIKKWSIKVALKKGLNLYIPPEWFYIFEVKGESIFSTTTSDSYFTYLYNCLR